MIKRGTGKKHLLEQDVYVTNARGAYKVLHDLGADTMEVIDSRLLEGQSGKAVAAWIQDELKQLPEMKPDTLKKMLERYRKTHLRQRTLARLAGFNGDRATKFLVQRLNAMDELEKLAREQRGRLDKMLEFEKKGPTAMTAVSAEVKLLKEVLTDLARVQLDTGVLHRAPKTVTGTLTNPDGTQIAEFSWTEEAQKLLHDLEQFDVVEDA